MRNKLEKHYVKLLRQKKGWKDMKYQVLLLICVLLVFGACDIRKPTLPVWDITLQIPLLNETYFVSDLVDSVNIVTDSGGLMYLQNTGEFDTPEAGVVSFTPTVNLSGIHIPSGIGYDGVLPLIYPEVNLNLNYGLVSSGSIKTHITNVDPRLKVLEIVFNDIRNDQDIPLMVHYTGNQAWVSTNIEGYHFGDASSSSDLTELSFRVNAESTTGEQVDLATLSVALDEQISFSEFHGRITNYEIPVDARAADIEIEYPYNIDQAITIQNASIKMNVLNHIGFDCEFEGILIASNGTVTDTLRILNDDGRNFIVHRAIGNTPGQSILEIQNITKLLRIMPTSIKIQEGAKFTIESGDTIGVLKQSDKIHADYVVSAPFRFVLHDSPISVQDPVKIEISKENRDRIKKNAVSSSLSLRLLNTLPIGAIAEVYFGNSSTMDVNNPVTYRFKKTAQVKSKTTEPGEQLVSISLSKSELAVFTEPTAYLKWVFMLEDTNGVPVEITANTSDYLRIISKISAVMTVEGF